MDLLVRKLEHVSWFFDFDGSLCPHQEVWEKRTYNPEDILRLLSELQKKTQKIFWNTGRRPESLGSVHPDYLQYSGYFIQGTAYWDAETQRRELLVDELAADYVQKIEAHFINHARFRLEKKPTSLRIAPGPKVSMDEMPEILAGLPHATPANWNWIVGHRGAELLPVGFDKGSALRDGLRRIGKTSVPVAVGDDVLDRAAIEAAIEADGYAVLVGEGCGWITEVKHRPEQIIFCEHPSDVHQLVWEMLKR